MAVRLSALGSFRALPPGSFLVLISARGWVDSRAVMRLEGLGQLQKSISSALDPATFRVVAQCLKWLRYRMPPLNKQYKGLGFNHFYVQSPCNPLTEDYTEIFYMTAKGDILFIEFYEKIIKPESSLILMFHFSISARFRCSFLRT
jgi:hypothetical protein